MGKSGKKPRSKGLDPRQFEATTNSASKQDKRDKDEDFNFEEFARLKAKGKRAW